MKVCTKCREPQDLSGFSKCKRSKDGHYGKCKFCEKTYREANKKRIAERGKKWREENPEKIAKWHEANKDSRSEYQKEYYKANKDHLTEYHEEYRKSRKAKQQEDSDK